MKNGLEEEEMGRLIKKLLKLFKWEVMGFRIKIVVEEGKVEVGFDRFFWGLIYRFLCENWGRGRSLRWFRDFCVEFWVLFVELCLCVGDCV